MWCCGNGVRKINTDFFPRSTALLWHPANTSFVQKIFHITEWKRKPDVQHHSQADDLWARFKVPEWGVFCHMARLRNHPARLKLVLSDSTSWSIYGRKWSSDSGLGSPARNNREQYLFVTFRFKSFRKRSDTWCYPSRHSYGIWLSDVPYGL